MLTAETARATWSYDPETGVLRWKIRPAQRVRVGDIAGTLHRRNHTSYLELHLKGKTYMAHRVIWLMIHDAWPDKEIDHINSIGTDNRIENLRDVSHSENVKNKRMYKANKSGFCGVCWFKRNSKWMVRITINSKYVHLGYFTNLEDAIEARQSANIAHGFHALHGTNKE